MANVVNVLTELINFEVFGKEFDKETFVIDQNMAKSLFALSKKHDVAHLICDALLKNSVKIEDENLNKQFFNEFSLAVFRREKQDYALNKIVKLFKDNGVEYVLLKGSVIKDYYPESWMRTSSDIDILVKEKDLKRAGKLLVEKLNFKKSGRWLYDESYVSADKLVHVELHFELSLVDRRDTNEVLYKVWDNVDGEKLNNEMLYFYHIAHMMKHFYGGGCGLRPFIDLLLIKNIKVDEDRKKALLEEGGLTKFAFNMENTADCLFNGKSENDFTLKIEKFILEGGVYGDMINWNSVQVAKNGSFKKHVFARLFLKREQLEKLFPKLKNHGILLPYYQVKRWLRVIFTGRVKKTVQEVKNGSSLSKEQIEETKKFLDDLGLGE